MTIRETALAALPALALGVTGCGKGECPITDKGVQEMSDYYKTALDDCVAGVPRNDAIVFSHMDMLLGEGSNYALELRLFSNFHCELVKGDKYVPEFSLSVEDADGNVWCGTWDSEAEKLSFN
jgi:hypothetical protein